MTGCSTSKLILPVALLLLIQCHNTEAGKMTNLMQSILDTLKNIESLLKDENVFVENKPSLNYEYVSGVKPNPDLSSKTNENSSPNSNNNTVDEVVEKQTEEEQLEIISSKDKSKEPQILKKSVRRNSNSNQNINQNINQNTHWPKLRSIMEVNDPKKKSKIINHSDNDSDHKNEDAVKRLFDPSSEEIE